MKAKTHADIKLSILNARGMVVEDMLQEETVNIIVGDSGIGKSPLLVQLGLCVAAGVPFIDLPVQKGPVLYVDYENAASNLADMIDNLLIHLGLPEAPETFRVLHFPESTFTVSHAIRELSPVLVIIDALRGYNPSAEKDNSSAAACIAQIQKVAETAHCTFLLLHHTRKTDKKEPGPKLSACGTVDWLQEAAGGRALVNQTSARFGVESYTIGEADLILKGHFKLKGEVGPFYLTRLYSEYGNELGYNRLKGLGLLNQSERERFLKLPDTFSWHEASDLLFPGKKVGKTLAQLLARAKAASLIVKSGEKKNIRYTKLPSL